MLWRKHLGVAGLPTPSAKAPWTLPPKSVISGMPRYTVGRRTLSRTQKGLEHNLDPVPDPAVLPFRDLEPFAAGALRPALLPLGHVTSRAWLRGGRERTNRTLIT